MPYRHGLPLVGRERELATLTGLLHDARQRRPQFALLVGEAGVGKTTLIEALLDAAGSNASVARGGCRQGHFDVPFEPFAEALRTQSRVSGVLVEQTHPALGPLLYPDSGWTSAGSAPSRLRLFDAVLEFLADQSQAAILVLDDFQWADTSSMELLTFLARNARLEAVLVVVACRSGYGDATREMFDELRRSASTVAIDLAPFGPAEMTKLAVAARGAAPTADELLQLARLTGGNPFFVEQALLSADPRQVLPPAVSELLQRDLDALGESGREAAQLLAVAGGRLPATALESALGATAHDAIQQVLEERVATASPDTYELRHSLFRDAILGRLLPGGLRALHGRLAALEESPVSAEALSMSAEEIAQHWQAAGNRARALPAYARAARRAAGSLAFSEANRQWATVLTLLERPDEAIEDHELLLEALVGAAVAARWLGDTDRAVDLLTRALSVTTSADRLQRARLHCRRAHYRRLLGQVDAAAWDADHAVSLIHPDDPDRIRAELVYEQARLLVIRGDIDAGTGPAMTALDLARSVGDAALEGRVLGTLAALLVHQGQIDRALAVLRDAQQLAASYGDFDDQVRTAANLSYAYIEAGRLRDALAAATEALELSRRAGVDDSVGAAATAAHNAVVALVDLGRWPEAEQRLTALLNWSSTTTRRVWRLGARAMLYASMGRFELAGVDLDEADRLGVEERWARASHAAAAAELAIWRHEPESALQHASTELHLTDPPLDRVYLLRWCLWALGDLADLARRRGNSAARDDAAARARQLMDDYGVGVTTATGSPQLRALAQAEYARATTGSDAQLWLGVVEMTPDRPYDQAYSLYRRAEALADAGLDHGAAGAAATDAQQLARDLGAAPLLDSIDALITRTNLTVAATPNQVAGTAASPVLLTARELQVLAQLRCGMSNRRIGRALNISEKTASVHVSNILGKLGVGNRTAAAAVAHQLGL